MCSKKREKPGKEIYPVNNRQVVKNLYATYAAEGLAVSIEAKIYTSKKQS